ncbi:MAG: hypothetical protein IPK69_10355 [Phycisphaerales bacterium]|nr:MAG: hypothetical protein IPK69_10355 [Phycisphaerales bacterium]
MHARLPLRMNFHVLLAATLVCATLVFLPSCGEKDYNAREARQAFEAWQNAYSSSDTKTIADMCQKDTIDRYTRLIPIALAFGKREEIRAMSNADKYEVLFMRAMVPRKELLKMDGRAYVEYMARIGHTMDPRKRMLPIMRVRATDDYADITLKAEANGQAATTFRLVRVGDRWLFDERDRLQAIEQELSGSPRTVSSETDRAFVRGLGTVAGLTDRDLTDVWDRCIR